MVNNQRSVFFWQSNKGGKIGPGCLSQWASYSFVIDGVLYRYAEQYMMAEKARLFHDDASLNKIMKAKSPMIVKRLGRQIKGRAGGKWDPQDVAAWNAVRFDVVVRGNFAKFSQNAELKEYLLSTGDAILAEASPKDAVWGIGIDAERAVNVPQSDWPGQSLLGKALMKVRDMLKVGKGKELLEQGTVPMRSEPDAIVSAEGNNMTAWNKEDAINQIKNGGPWGHKCVMGKVYKHNCEVFGLWADDLPTGVPGGLGDRSALLNGTKVLVK